MQENEPISVSTAMAHAKSALEQCSFCLVGEVSELNNKAGYKAVYFTVKDEHASLPCQMWKSRYDAQGVDMKVGSLVVLVGRFSLYAPKGRMNFEVFSITLSGEGQLRLEVANRAKKLAQEGLMDPSRKRPLPAYPERIGLVTSPRGAAVHDVMRTLRRRYPMAEILLAGVPVEGELAARHIVDGMVEVVHAGAEVLLLVRGGGSFEDLMPFNDERLARTISRCPIPVVTGIGHEPDTSIADMVADKRASTPTAAAEAVSPSTEALMQQFAVEQQRLNQLLNHSLERLDDRLLALQQRALFKDPHMLFATDEQTLDNHADSLTRFAEHSLVPYEHALSTADARLSTAIPHALRRDAVALDARSQQLRSLGASLLQPARHALEVRAVRLEDVSPIALLSRGYSLVKNDQNNLVTSVFDVSPGDKLRLDLNDGMLSCVVDDVHPSSRKPRYEER